MSGADTDRPPADLPPFGAPDPDALERGRLLFAQPCVFLKGAVKLDQLPGADRPEIPFAGRSNVGKSSLLNALTGRLTLARTSHTPGRTRELNFFDLGSDSLGWLRLVDLPGYGYAKVSRSRAEAWDKVMRAYLRGRPNLRRTIVLVDARQGIKPSDETLFAMLDEAAVSYQLVLTKADKLKPAGLARMLDATARALRAHVAAHPRIIATSCRSELGIAELRTELAALAERGTNVL